MSVSNSSNYYSNLITKSSIQKFLKKNVNPDQSQISISLKFWQRIMNECVRRKYLKNKNLQYQQCPPKSQNKIRLKNVYNDYGASAECHKKYREQIQKYMLEMQFFMKKFDKCVQQGLGARYNIENVEEVCGNKIIKFIRGNGDIL